MLQLKIRIDGSPIREFNAGLNALMPTPKKRLELLEAIQNIILSDIPKNYQDGGATFQKTFKDNSPFTKQAKDKYWRVTREYTLPSILDNPLVQIDTGATAHALITGQSNVRAEAVRFLTPDLLRLGVKINYDPLTKEVLIGLSPVAYKKILVLMQDLGRGKGISSPVPSKGV